MSVTNGPKLITDATQMLSAAIASAAAGDPAPLIAAAPAVLDVLAQLLLLLPPIDAPALDPVTRGELDAAAEAEAVKP